MVIAVSTLNPLLYFSLGLCSWGVFLIEFSFSLEHLKRMNTESHLQNLSMYLFLTMKTLSLFPSQYFLICLFFPERQTREDESFWSQRSRHQYLTGFMFFTDIDFMWSNVLIPIILSMVDVFSQTTESKKPKEKLPSCREKVGFFLTSMILL